MSTEKLGTADSTYYCEECGLHHEKCAGRDGVRAPALRERDMERLEATFKVLTVKLRRAAGLGGRG